MSVFEYDFMPFIGVASEFFLVVITRSLRFVLGGKFFYIFASIIEGAIFIFSIEYDFFVPQYEKEESDDSDDTVFV